MCPDVPAGTGYEDVHRGLPYGAEEFAQLAEQIIRLRSPTRETSVGELLAETATLDAGLAQQLAVLLLRHTLAALLDHGAHTKSLSKPCEWDRARTLTGTAGTGLDGACGATSPRCGALTPGTNRSSVPAHFYR